MTNTAIEFEREYQPPSFFIGDTNTDITFKIFYSTLHEEISGLLKCYNDYGMSTARSSVIKKYVEKITEAHSVVLAGKSQIIQELFLLHQTCNAFDIYNKQFICYSSQEFRAKILFPNLVYMLMKHFHKARKFIQGVIRSVYAEKNKQAYGLVQRYANSYYLDHDIIKNDALLEFLGNALKKFDPFTVNNIKHFYKQVFRQIFFYYFKKKEGAHTSYTSIWDIDSSISQLLNVPTRLIMYRDVLYALQTNRFCETSPTLNQLNYNYTIFRNVIVNNELQDMFYSCSNDSYMLTDKRYKLMKIYSKDADDKLLQEIKKLPTIYRLLKCVHIVNPKARPYNEMMIKPDILKSAVLEELMYPFRNMFADSHLHGILSGIAGNFTSNILSGEYINLLTLSNVRINQISFITQVKQFVRLCISENIVND